MLGFAGSSMGLFAIVWSLMCLVSGALVIDSMLRATPNAAAFDADQAQDVPARHAQAREV